jgi:Ca-activated chloride channel homolog
LGLLPGPPSTPGQVILLLGGALLAALAASAGLAAVSAWWDRLRRWQRLRLSRDSRLLRWLARKGVPLGFGVLLAAGLVIGVPRVWEQAYLRIAGCLPATQLRMVATPETLTTARQLANAYEQWTAGENHGCPTVDVYVYAATTDEIRERIEMSATDGTNGTGDGWTDSGALLEIGPRPDVWLAATSHEVDGLDTAIVASSQIAHSPVVLAVPFARAAQGTGPDGSWTEVFARLTDQGVGVVRADPSSTRLGMLATALLYGMADPGAAASPQQLTPPEVEQRIAVSLDAGGFPLTDTFGLLCRHRLLGSQAAVITSEQHVVQFNRGEPLGASCLSRRDSTERLVAEYPSDSRTLDHQFVRFAWSDPPQEEAAVGFGEWLRGDHGREAITATGLRPVGRPSVAGALNTTGVDPAVLPGVAPLPPKQWHAATDAYHAAQRRGRVLFALDTSGSMAAVAPEGTRSAVMADAILAALPGMGPRDQFGLWLFPDSAGTGYVEAVPLGPPEPARIAAAEQVLNGLLPAGNTPLFRSMIDAAAALHPDDPAQVDAVVVVTDGEDTSSGLGPDAVSAALAGSGVRLVVIAIGELRCSDSGLAEVALATAGECIGADLSDLEQTLVTETAGLWGGR